MQNNGDLSSLAPMREGGLEFIFLQAALEAGIRSRAQRLQGLVQVDEAKAKSSNAVLMWCCETGSVRF